MYLIQEQSEHDCLFTFDFSKVYWNSRLQNEHRRLVDLFRPDDLIADVFAGVGPFALPAAVKGCAVMANDLNPNSAEFLTLNAINNRVRDDPLFDCRGMAKMLTRCHLSCVFPVQMGANSSDPLP